MRSSVVRGALAGAVGGLAGTLAMNYAQRLWTLAADGEPPQSAAGPHDARDWQERSEHQNSNELAAQAVASTVLDRRLHGPELAVGAAFAHFTFGAAVGALHGALVEPHRRQRRTGMALGIALWAVADEIAMPLLKLSRPTVERPFEMHAQAFAAHLVYGIVTEKVRRVMRS